MDRPDEKAAPLGQSYDTSLDEFFVTRNSVWQEVAISGVLHNAKSFGEGWWYRVQAVDEVVASDFLDAIDASGKSLRSYAKSGFPLPKGKSHVSWSPQWVPAGSLSRDLKKAFWHKMPPKFWVLVEDLGKDVIWREEVEHLDSVCHTISRHLCTRKGCAKCELISSCRVLDDHEKQNR